MHFNKPRRFICAAPFCSFSSRSAIFSLLNGVVCGADPDRSAFGFIPDANHSALHPRSPCSGVGAFPGTNELTPGARRNKTKGQPVSVGAGSTGSNFIN
jgi:hypothetical protein